MKNRIVKKILRIIFLIFVGAAVVGTFYFLWKKAQPVITLYELVTPARDTIETKTVATGKVEPRDEVLIKPQMSGIISELLKEAGQMVKEGEIIARIKVIPEMVQLNSAESRVRVAKISLEQISATFKRDEELHKQGVISKEDYETSLANYKKAQEEAENAQDALEIIREGISKRSAASSTTQVRSTITGMILDVPIKVGNSVIQANTFNDGTTIATVADMGDMLFRGNVDETDIGRLHAGMPVVLTIGAMQGTVLQATLEYISPKAADVNGIIMFEVKAAAKIPESVFVRAGYSANASIVTDSREGVLTLPESTIQFEEGKPCVYILTSPEESPEQTFEKRDVTLGLSDGVNIEIVSGVTETDKVRNLQQQSI